MSIAELKEEAIHQFAAKVQATDDEKTLQAILDFINTLDVQHTAPTNLSQHYDSIKAKYSSVLHKLAQ